MAIPVAVIPCANTCCRLRQMNRPWRESRIRHDTEDYSTGRTDPVVINGPLKEEGYTKHQRYRPDSIDQGQADFRFETGFARE